MNNSIREQVLGVVAGIRGEKRASKGKAGGNVVGWLKEYMGRGKKLRGAIRDAERANADLASKGQQLKELLGKRTADAALLRKYRPLVNEVRQLANSGELVWRGKLSPLNDKFFSLASESRRGRPDILAGLGSPSFDPREFEVIGGTAFPGVRLYSGDLARIKAYMAPHRSVKADKQAIKELKQYLGTHSVSSTDALRSRLRKYYLANTAAGVAGAAGLGGAGYGTYKALSGKNEPGAAGSSKAAEMHKAAQPSEYVNFLHRKDRLCTAR